VKILFVAFSESIHTARWINLLSDSGFVVCLFPSLDNGQMHPDLNDTHIYHSFYYGKDKAGAGSQPHGIPVPNLSLSYVCRDLLRSQYPDYRVRQLVRLIRKIQPDVIHSLEFQAGGYLTLEAKKRYGPGFPPWIATNWGSDLYLFGRLEAHREKVREVLREAGYYSCECARDIGLAKDLGFAGKLLPVIPTTGGFDLDHAEAFQSGIPPSRRRLILLKGYQGWAGRALVGLRALALCRDWLKDYQIAIFGAFSVDVQIAAELLQQELGIPVDIIPHCGHDEILKHFGRARIYLGLSISDAISTSVLESMAMGAFPIQSNTACTDEWITDGISGLVVPPEDPQVVADAIKIALKNDALVDEAARINQQVVKGRLDRRKIKEQVIRMYRDIYNETQSVQ
jgi:glycosyltransferase involved in cell wall biosynthesis